MANETETKLYRLSDVKDYKVAKNEPDIRGWEVKGQDGNILGHVHDLIIDPDMMKVRYLQLKLDKEIYVSKGDRYILLPVGRAKLHREEHRITVQNLDRSNIRFYPIYRGEAITREYEYGLREALKEKENNADRTVYEEHNRFGEEYENIKDQYAGETESDDPVVRMRAERDIARAEKDIVKAENEVLKMQLRNIRKVLHDDFYNHEHFNEGEFYGEQTNEKRLPQKTREEENG